LVEHEIFGDGQAWRAELIGALVDDGDAGRTSVAWRR
jgi:hypothetical protein